MSAITNNCPRSIDPELWDGMSADARYQAQKDARNAAQRISVLHWVLLAPPLLFMALPPVQTLVNKHLPPSHYVRLNGRTDPRKFLNETPLKVGDRVAGEEVTSAFGLRIHPVTFEQSQHNGVDVGTATGTPLYAPAVGNDKVKVQCWEDSNGGGLVANISSESIPDYRFKALHLSTCESGSYQAGMEFARTGDSGIGTGEHLDWRQQPANADTYVEPMRGYVQWVLDGGVGDVFGNDVVDIPALKAAIIGQESGGDAAIVNRHSGALGLGQVMPENLEGTGRGWDFDALGKDLTPAEFLADEDAQNKIIEHQLGAIAFSQSVDASGNPRSEQEIAERSAAVWYSGRGDYCSSFSGEVFGAGSYPSGAEYCASVGARFEEEKTLQQRRLTQLDK